MSSQKVHDSTNARNLIEKLTFVHLPVTPNIPTTNVTLHGLSTNFSAGALPAGGRWEGYRIRFESGSRGTLRLQCIDWGVVRASVICQA